MGVVRDIRVPSVRRAFGAPFAPIEARVTCPALGRVLTRGFFVPQMTRPSGNLAAEGEAVRPQQSNGTWLAAFWL
jgi:hypothetical protein